MVAIVDADEVQRLIPEPTWVIGEVIALPFAVRLVEMSGPAL